MTPPSSTSRFDISIRELVALIWMQKWLALVVAVVVVAIAMVWTALSTPMYSATAVIEISPEATQELRFQRLQDAVNTNGQYNNQQFYRTETQKLTSLSAREEIVRRYLAKGYDDLPMQGGPGALSGMLSVTPRTNSRLIDVSAEHSDPDRAAVLANLVAEVYIDQNLVQEQQRASRARTWLEDQLKEYTQKIETAQAELLEFRAINELADVQESLSTQSARLKELNEVSASVSTERVLAETTRDDHRKLLARGEYDELLKVVDSSLVSAMSATFASARTEHATVATKYGENHPKYMESAEHLARIRDEIDKELRKELRGEDAKVTLLRAKEASLDNQIDETRDALLAQQRLVQRHDQLKRQLETSQKFYDTLRQRYDELTVESRTQLNNATVIDSARPRPKPVSPRWSINLLVACLVGLGGGIALGLAREYVDDTIRSSSEVSLLLQVPYLGHIPEVPGKLDYRETALYTIDHPKSLVAEAVRGLRTLLQNEPTGIEIRRLLLTSAAASEGKTGTSTRLAAAFASVGKRVLLIDADLRRSQLHRIFQIDNSVGLTSVLGGTVDAAMAPAATSVPNLFVVAAGPRVANPNELLSSPRLQQALQIWDQQFDIIVLDSPPVALVADALTLAPLVDGVVVVVRAKTYPRHLVRQTVDRLAQVDATILGVVLNAIDVQSSGRYGGYGGYGAYYYRYESETPDEAA